MGICANFPRWYAVHELPSYPDDLNAMHDALMAQPPQFRIEFRAIMFAMANEAGVNVFDFGADKWAEAFLRTLNLPPFIIVNQ